MTMLGELSGSLAHELNQPLAAILANGQAAQRFLAHGDFDADELRDILKDIVDEDKRAGEVIQRLRLLLKKGEISRQPLDLNEVVLDVLKIVRSDLVNRAVVVETDLEEGIPSVMADRVQVQQVLLNLLTNACDAMADNGDEDRAVVVRTHAADDSAVRVSVVDRARASANAPWAASSSPSSRPRATAWGWAWRFAARSSPPTGGRCPP